MPNNVIDNVVREYVETNKKVKEKDEVLFKLIELNIEIEVEDPIQIKYNMATMTGQPCHIYFIINVT